MNRERDSDGEREKECLYVCVMCISMAVQNFRSGNYDNNDNDNCNTAHCISHLEAFHLGLVKNGFREIIVFYCLEFSPKIRLNETVFRFALDYFRFYFVLATVGTVVTLQSLYFCVQK